MLLLQWRELKAHIKTIKQELDRQAQVDPHESIYRRVPGIGPLVARVLSNELGDMSQFRNEKALLSYTGLTPGEHSSGGHIRRGHISRQGNSYLRYVLTEAVWRAIRKDEKLKEDFERIAAKRGKKRAIVAIGCKLRGRVRAAFQAQRMYEMGYKKAA